MTWLDIAVTATICLCAVLGFWRGILRSVLGIASLLAGILLAGTYYQQLALTLWPSGGAWTPAAAYAIILFGVLAATAILATLLARLVHMTPLGILDRILGLLAGTLIALAAWAIILMILLVVLPGADDLVAGSPVAQLILRWLAAIRGLPLATSQTALRV